MKIRVVFFFLFCINIIVLSQKPTQTLRGVVQDASTRETLPGANIVIRESEQGTITDMDGRFLFSEVAVGRYTLEARFVGYEPVVIPEIVVGSAKEIVLEIKMEERIAELDEVVIRSSLRKDQPQNSMAMISARTFSVEEARRYAGTLDDPARMAGNFAGVTTAGLNVNAIVVRGNAPKGLLWRLEGIDIPVPSHFAGGNVAGGGALSIFSSQVLANSDFYTGAFPAEYGNATAGVFDMKLRKGNNRKYEHSFQVGVQGVEIASEGPFSIGGQGSFLFNYRYSTMALVFQFLPETSDGNEIPVYQDLSFNLNMPSGNLGTLSLWGVGGLSETTSKGYDDPEKWESPENRERMSFQYNMGAGGITHQKTISDKSFIRTTLASGISLQLNKEKIRLDENNPDFLTPKNKGKNLEGKVTIASVFNHKVNTQLSWKAGIDANSLFYNLKGEVRDMGSGNYEEFLNGEGNTMLLQAHGQGKYQLSDKLTFTGGVNVSWLRINDETLLTPRFSFAWKAHPEHRFSLGYGKHSQTEPLFVYFVEREDSQGVVLPNERLERSKAHHFVLGYDWSPSGNFRLKVEPYYQRLYDVPVVAGSAYSMINFKNDWSFDKELVNRGTGTNLGLDLTIERFLHEGLYYMVSSSLYDSKYVGGDGVERRSRYDGGYVVNVLGGKEWTIRQKNLFGLNLRMTAMGPHWYHPVDEAASHVSGDIVYDETAGFSDRYSDLEIYTDLTITYRINGKSSSSILALQVKNLIGKQYQGKTYNLKSQSIEDEFFTSAIPFISYKIEF
ncbi:TonB-dependent receptor [Marinilabilia sp.]|uniref:TonB-dependent receptor n=1 Tax=Marinilabilia sp. TaxID=2021252 RepID=UPI0025BDE52E|nr:TonB-dependent receptor [Marinilabilia sp.]